MGISWKTYKKHKSIWNETVAQVQNQNVQGLEHYFKAHAIQLDSSALTSKSHDCLFKGGKGVNVQLFYLDIAREITNIASHWCEDAEKYMQENHKWHNRTYAAEGGLGAEIIGMEEDAMLINLYHSVYYGVYLETRIFPRAGNLEIINPTLQAFAPRLMFEMQGFLDRM